MSIAELVAEIEKERDEWKESAEFANQKASTIAADRDHWMERAEKAEGEKLKGIGDYGLALHRAEAAEKLVKELEERCNHRGRAVDELNARIAELERQLSERPFSTLEAVLEECRIAGICAGVGVVDRQEFRIHIDNSCGISRVTYAPDASSAASAIESIVCDRDFYPHSSFARRRREEKETPQPTPESTPGFPRKFAQKVSVVQEEVRKSSPTQPTPNYSKTSNSSTDPVEELSDGDWYVSFARNGVIDISAKGGGLVV